MGKPTPINGTMSNNLWVNVSEQKYCSDNHYLKIAILLRISLRNTLRRRRRWRPKDGFGLGDQARLGLAPPPVERAPSGRRVAHERHHNGLVSRRPHSPAILSAVARSAETSWLTVDGIADRGPAMLFCVTRKTMSYPVSCGYLSILIFTSLTIPR
jgi:hypothetical protein